MNIYGKDVLQKWGVFDFRKITASKHKLVQHKMQKKLTRQAS